jgi:hypothetical protein
MTHLKRALIEKAGHNHDFEHTVYHRDQFQTVNGLMA